jgi:DNA-binding response OmpR family regulator
MGAPEINPSSDSLETVLLVEPEQSARAVVSEYLRECGFEVIVADTGEAALKMIDHGTSISVILAAVKLPGDMNGFHLARNIRTYYPDIEVLLVSDDAESAEVASDLCDEGPMEKPYHPKEVLERIRALRAARKR